METIDLTIHYYGFTYINIDTHTLFDLLLHFMYLHEMWTMLRVSHYCIIFYEKHLACSFQSPAHKYFTLIRHRDLIVSILISIHGTQSNSRNIHALPYLIYHLRIWGCVTTKNPFYDVWSNPACGKLFFKCFLIRSTAFGSFNGSMKTSVIITFRLIRKANKKH